MRPGRQRLKRGVEWLRKKHISSRNWRSCHFSQAYCWVVTGQHLLSISHCDLVRKASSLGCLQHFSLLPCTFLHSTGALSHVQLADKSCLTRTCCLYSALSFNSTNQMSQMLWPK